MRQTSARALLGAAALGIATIAFPLSAAAEPDNASPSATEHCDDDLTKIEGESGSYDGDHGTITWGATRSATTSPRAGGSTSA